MDNLIATDCGVATGSPPMKFGTLICSKGARRGTYRAFFLPAKAAIAGLQEVEQRMGHDYMGVGARVMPGAVNRMRHINLSVPDNADPAVKST